MRSGERFMRHMEASPERYLLFFKKLIIFRKYGAKSSTNPIDLQFPHPSPIAFGCWRLSITICIVLQWPLHFALYLASSEPENNVKMLARPSHSLFDRSFISSRENVDFLFFGARIALLFYSEVTFSIISTSFARPEAVDDSGFWTFSASEIGAQLYPTAPLFYEQSATKCSHLAFLSFYVIIVAAVS